MLWEASTPSGETLLLRAHVYVLAGGASNARLLRRATSHRGRAISRMSYMLIAAGKRLPPISFILPGNDFYGMFVVSRPLREAGNAWLMSNFVSLAHEGHNARSRKLWLRSVLRHLGEVAPVLHDADIRWGFYDAAKGELRDSPGVMGGHSFETFGIGNLFAMAPTKLTLAPLLADEVAEACAGRLVGLPRTRSDVSGGRLPVVQERWLGAARVPLEQLLERVGCPEASQSLWSPPQALTTPWA